MPVDCHTNGGRLAEAGRCETGSKQNFITLYKILATGIALFEKFKASLACDCDICRDFCKRPGWWTVDQAKNAIKSGLAPRMMMEISPEFNFAVLSPAFYGCEGFIATQEGAQTGCNFQKDGLCELHNTEFLPLECAFCHHDRIGEGEICHKAIEDDWKTFRGQNLVRRWQKKVDFEQKLKFLEEGNKNV